MEGHGEQAEETVGGGEESGQGVRVYFFFLCLHRLLSYGDPTHHARHQA